MQIHEVNQQYILKALVELFHFSRASKENMIHGLSRKKCMDSKKRETLYDAFFPLWSLS